MNSVGKDQKERLKSGCRYTDFRELRQYLCSLAEPKYQKFTSSLIPNVPADYILGVRIPTLRKIAREIAKGDWEAYLSSSSDDYLEEVMLQGMVIGSANMPIEETLKWVAWFIPKINNWSVCDSFCASLKMTKKHMQEVWEFIEDYLRDDREYFIRFGVVMLLDYYTDEAYVTRALQLLDGIKSEYYYVKMAVAWAVSMYYLSDPQQTLEFLKNCHLDDFTYNKSLQKITESLKVDKETKAFIRSMKRKV